MTKREKLEAIQARLYGAWDDPVLVKVGPLTGNMIEDVQWILDAPDAWEVEK
jgi:hypothetical protein